MPESIEDEIENGQSSCGDLEYDSADDEIPNYEKLLPLNVRYQL